MKRFVAISLLACCAGLFPPAYAQTPAAKKKIVISDQTKKVCNEVMRGIFDEIMAVKDQYENLEDFSAGNYTLNKFGLGKIVYSYELDKDQPEHKRRRPYTFGITIVPMDQEIFGGEHGLFELGFPVLKLKIAGYFSRRLLKTQLNIAPFVKKYGAKLAEYEQKFLPLRVFVRPSKREYTVREPIEFTVFVQNVSKRGMLVEGLNANTLFFLIDGQFWGKGEKPVETDPKKIRRQQRNERRELRKIMQTKKKIQRMKEKGTYRPPPAPDSVRGRAILRSGEALQRTFGGQSFLSPREVEIVAIYKRDIDGVNPMYRTTIRIVEDPDSRRRGPE